MARYRKVKHVMIPLRDVSPAQKAWIEWNAELCEAFSQEAHDDDPELVALDSYLVQTAADLVWTYTAGKPTWSAFDPDDYLRRHAEGIGWGEDRKALAIVTMVEFLEFLISRGHLDTLEGLGLLRRLERHVNVTLRAAGYEPRYATAAPS